VQKIGFDGIRCYLSGAASDGGAQSDPSAALGNYRSSTRAESLGFLYGGTLRDVTIDHVSGANGPGTASLIAVGANALTYAAPGGSQGDSVTILNGETRAVFDGSDPAKFVTVTRATATDLAGAATLTLVRQFNNLFGFDNVPSGEASAGEDYYRCAIIKNHLEYEAAPRLYIHPLGAYPRYSNVAQLPASGAGTIETSGGAYGTFADWPETGWCRIAHMGLREVVYYTSRTDLILTVPAAGRARLGSSSSAGMGNDPLMPIPGIRFGIEAPSSQPAGYVQTIANEKTAPSAISWNVPINYSNSLALGPLPASHIVGLWIHREIPAGAVAEPRLQNWFHIGCYLAP